MKPTRKDGYEFFHEGTRTLARMESNGIKIDTAYLDGAIAKTAAQIKEKDDALKSSKLFKVWKRRFGGKTNLDSASQLAAVLFEEIGHEPIAYTEKSMQLDRKLWKASTDEYSLRNVDDPFVKDYFAVKKLKKVLGTYLKGIRREVDEDGVLHPSYNLAGGPRDDKKGGAASYRSSSSDPNFQNLPIRNKVMGALIRPCIVARKGRHLIEVDFSGIEVRAAAFYNWDPNLIRYIKDKTTDMHRDEACELFMLTPDQVVKSTTRDCAKNQWVFPQFYGSVWFQCAPNIWEAMDRRKFMVGETNVSVRKHLAKHGITKLGNCDPKAEPRKGTFARHLINAEKKLWHKRFPVYTQWKKSFYNTYLKRGYFDLFTGFRCAGFFRRNQVINFPVQGTAFHCLLWALIQIQKELTKRKMRTLLVGQIHDSLLADAPTDEVQEFLTIAKRVMTADLPNHWSWINVPLETEADVVPIGGSWIDKQEWVEKHGLWVLKV